MIDLYTFTTPNGHKASIMLEETPHTPVSSRDKEAHRLNGVLENRLKDHGHLISGLIKPTFWRTS
jgi:hypothetical protein